MDDPIINSLISGTYLDQQTGEMVGVKTRKLAIEPSLAGMEKALVDQLGFGKRIAIVSDVTTHRVLAHRVEDSLTSSYAVQSIVLPGRPHPDDTTVAKLRTEGASADAWIAVGSGTVNDLCKYAAALDGKPYAVFATAPSMNGYTSFNAAITVHGHKMSLPAQTPAGAFFDLEILAAAPSRLIRAGLGDSLCRCTAQADWMLSHLLFGTEYRQLPFDLLAEDEGPLFDGSAALLAGDLDLMRRLVRTLVMAGFGTAIIGHSQPASQGEHLVSHFLDMFESPSRPIVFHGEQVGVTTLSMARLQHQLVKQKPVVRVENFTEADFVGRYGEELGRSCWKEFSNKRLTPKRAEEVNDILQSGWLQIRDTLESIIIPPDRLEAVLLAAGAPTKPDEIFLDRADYEKALRQARDIRNRYTHLDLAAASSGLEKLIPAL